MLFWKKDDNGCHIEIWTMEGNGTSKRENERLTSRKLLTHILQKDAVVNYDEHGKPHVDNHHISIAHTGEYVGVIASKTYVVGVDLERIRERRIDELAEKFMDADELDRLKEAAEQIKYFYLVWGAKEVLYKIYGKKGLLFQENLKTENFELTTKGHFKHG